VCVCVCVCECVWVCAWVWQRERESESKEIGLRHVRLAYSELALPCSLSISSPSLSLSNKHTHSLYVPPFLSFFLPLTLSPFLNFHFLFRLFPLPFSVKMYYNAKILSLIWRDGQKTYIWKQMWAKDKAGANSMQTHVL